MLFKFSCFDITLRIRIQFNIPLKYTPTIINLPKSLLKLNIRVPSVLRGLPRHPVFKNGPHLLKIPHHLLHQGILVPKLVNTWQVFTGSLPNIPGMVDKLVSHFHVGVLQPESDVLEVYGQCSLEYWSRSLEFVDGRLPLCVLYPRPQVVFLTAQRIFKVLSHAVLVVF